MMWTNNEIQAMRDAQLALMGDTVTVDRGAGEVWDEESQSSVASWETVYAGRGRVAVEHGSPTVSVSGESVTPQTVWVTVPHDVLLMPGDRVTVSQRDNVPATVWVASVESSALPASACRASCTVVR